ncbi:caspase-7 isoform X2 [Osmerus eperlanus]|uniref:caspase-7 isoform X2 n=1 Tax=Osmerus eperlanus TaxID=29151 RepID=UPI002E152411
MDLQTQLLKADRALSSDEVQSLVFLCTDLLKKDLQSVSSAMKLFSLLSDKGLLSAQQPDLLVELLDTIQRRPLIRELNLGDLLPKTRSLISLYRHMLYDLSENITEDELKEIKFLLTDRLPRRKRESMTTLEVFLEMEHKDCLSSTNLDLLNTIIEKVVPMLKKKIDQFVTAMENSPVTEQTEFEKIRRRSASDYLPGHQVPSLAPERPASCGEFGSVEPLLPPSFYESISAENISLDIPIVQASTIGRLSETLECLSANEDNASANSQGYTDSPAISSRASGTLGPGRSQTANTATEVPLGLTSRAPTQTSYGGLGKYPMRRGKMGVCLIINNEDFTRSSPKLKNREGTLVDENSLRSVFEWLGFLILIERDCSRARMLSVLRNLASSDHSHVDCLVCCVLSHGREGCVYGVDGSTVRLGEITEPFNGLLSSTLREKPKIFFVQACQGTLEQQPVPIESDGSWSRSGPTGDSLCCDARVPRDSIASHADFLIGMATVPDFASYRDRQQGTWYIQSLCQNLVQLVPRGVDLVSILTKVNDDVSRKTDVYGSRKQMPQPAFSLRKGVFFPIPDQPPPPPFKLI